MSFHSIIFSCERESDNTTQWPNTFSGEESDFNKALWQGLAQLSLQKSLTWPWGLLLALYFYYQGSGSVRLGSEQVQLELKRPTRDLLIWIYQFALVQTSLVQSPTNSNCCRAKVELLIFYIVGCSIMQWLWGFCSVPQCGGGDLRIIVHFVFSTLKNFAKL